MAKKSRTQQVVMTLRFNKPVTNAAAVRAARNHFYGEIYGTWPEETEGDGWEKAKIGAFKRLPEAS